MMNDHTVPKIEFESKRIASQSRGSFDDYKSQEVTKDGE
jgi:hypothetical protein